MSDFSVWLEDELRKKNMRPADLARKSGLVDSVISNILADRRGVGIDVCNAIAIGLSLPPEIVFRAAGHLPQTEEPDAQTREAEWLLSHMTPEKRQQALDYIRFLAESAEERGKSASPTKKSVEQPEQT